MSNSSVSDGYPVNVASIGFPTYSLSKMYSNILKNVVVEKTLRVNPFKGQIDKNMLSTVDLQFRIFFGPKSDLLALFFQHMSWSEFRILRITDRLLRNT